MLCLGHPYAALKVYQEQNHVHLIGDVFSNVSP